jgi:hypothetical protein
MAENFTVSHARRVDRDLDVEHELPGSVVLFTSESAFYGFEKNEEGRVISHLSVRPEHMDAVMAAAKDEALLADVRSALAFMAEHA